MMGRYLFACYSTVSLSYCVVGGKRWMQMLMANVMQCKCNVR